MAGRSGNSVDLEVNFQGKNLYQFDLGVETRVFFAGNRPEMGQIILEANLEIKGDRFRQHPLRLPNRAAGRSDIQLQTKRNKLLPFSEDRTGKTKAVGILSHGAYQGQPSIFGQTGQTIASAESAATATALFASGL